MTNRKGALIEVSSFVFNYKSWSYSMGQEGCSTQRGVDVLILQPQVDLLLCFPDLLVEQFSSR